MNKISAQLRTDRLSTVFLGLKPLLPLGYDPDLGPLHPIFFSHAFSCGCSPGCASSNQNHMPINAFFCTQQQQAQLSIIATIWQSAQSDILSGNVCPLPPLLWLCWTTEKLQSLIPDFRVVLLPKAVPLKTASTASVCCGQLLSTLMKSRS